MKIRKDKIRTDRDTEDSIRKAKEQLLLNQADSASSNKDEQIAALYYESAARISRKM